MAFQMDVELSEDRESLRVEFLTRRMRLNATELDNIIYTLAQSRALMTPAHPNHQPHDHVDTDHPDMRWYVGPHVVPAQVRLALYHPGYGWITAPLTLDSTEKLEKQLRATRLAQSGTVTQTVTFSPPKL